MINNNITIIGLGYTGLPLLIEFYKKKYNVSGFDKDFHKVQRLKAGIDLTNELRSNDLKKLKKINLVNNIDSLLREATGLFRQYIIDEFMIPKETDWAQIQSSKKDLDDKIEERYSQMQQSFRELSDLL